MYVNYKLSKEKFTPDDGARASFVWEETGIPGENPHGRAEDDLTLPYTTPRIDRIGEKRVRYPTNQIIILIIVVVKSQFNVLVKIVLLIHRSW